MSRSVFKTQSNIHDDAFLRKYLTAERHLIFLQKTTILDTSLCPKYVSEIAILLIVE